MTVVPTGPFVFFLALATAPPDFAARNEVGESFSDCSWATAATFAGFEVSKAPMSGAGPRTRGLPSRSSGPSSPAMPASMVGEPAASW